MGDSVNLRRSVPEADATDNNTVNDVVGNREDTSFSDRATNPSVTGQLRGAYYHIHSPAEIYPTLADVVTVTASANVWTDYGAWTEIVPAATITNAFDIHWIDIHDISANGQYQLQLGEGGAGSESAICTVAFGRNAVQSQEGNIPCQVDPVDANTRISARLSSNNAAADTVGIKIYYHTYPDIT